jgi:PhzF family phenazine biosynthesis protein
VNNQKKNFRRRQLNIPYFHIDAFTDAPFTGNPAGVCPLETWLPDAILQKIAAENNLSETAFFVQAGDHYELRWFTPAIEIDLCGHATLASGYVLTHYLGFTADVLRFETKSGTLLVERQGDILTLDFPSRPGSISEIPAALTSGLGSPPAEVYLARDYLAVFPSQSDILAIQPDQQQLMQLDCLGIIVTAPGKDVDFVSRFFAPRAGIPEDPVTGSSHCTLIPYWAQRLGKTTLTARQLSARGGQLFCSLAGARVKIGGYAVTYMRGELEV